MASSVALHPVTVVRDSLRDIPEVEQVFASFEGEGIISILAVMAEKNYDAQKRLFDVEQQIIEDLAGIQVTFRLVVRSGRPLGELVSPKGTLLFARE